jgi:hypothetical protein
MNNNILFPQSTLSRMVQVEMKRTQFFQALADDRKDDMPAWLQFFQRLGIGTNLFYSKLADHAKYELAATALREFQRCIVKWSAADSDAKDHEIQLLVRLFARVEIFADGKFEVNKESMPLYNAAVLDVVKFFILEAQVMNEVLRKSNVGTRVERNDIVNALKEHWTEFRMPKKVGLTT